MKRMIVLFFLVLFTGSLFADWNPGDGHKMHFPQLPDPNGWDVALYEEPFYLADDWQCSETGYVCWIHFWISYWQDLYEEIDSIHVSIHDDVPAGIDPEFPWSHPGNLLWSYDFKPGEFTIRDPEIGDQGWFDPWWGTWEEHDHIHYYQVNTGTICDFTDLFYQLEGVIYWLDIAIYLTSGSEGYVGWKTSQDHFMDDAVYWDYVPSPGWYELIDPITFESLDMAFVINGVDDPGCPVELSTFSALYASGSAVLNWTTQSETNNQGWNIYRSDSNDFATSLQINYDLFPGAGTTSMPTEYQFTDEYPVIEGNTYWYWLESVDVGGVTDTYGPASLTIPGEGDIPELPQYTYLKTNYPNPFNPSTHIQFSVKEGEIASFTIFNTKGQILETQTYESGTYSLEWDGTEFGSGIYFYKLQSTNYSEVKKMLMIK